MSRMEILESGSVTSPIGFKASGVTAGLKKSGKPDMALVFSEADCTFGAAFTPCSFAAAPVRVSRGKAERSNALRAIIINSGNANACTGEKGLENAAKMCRDAAAMLGVDADKVVVASTGRIGVQMPMKLVDRGVELACAALSEDGGSAAADAIMTTDTVPKHVAAKVVVGGRVVTVGAMSKGVGMIDPRLRTVPHATMICVVTTDAAVSNAALSEMVGRCAENSFNRITVDGDMSTNDTLLVLANGASGVEIPPGTPAAALFEEALLAVLRNLARKMVMDGEGATKFVEIKVLKASTAAAAKLCAEAIANSLLCKTAWFGCDPNWGRIVAALGYSGAEFDPSRVNVRYNDKPVVENGGDAGTPESELAEVLRERAFTITVELNDGAASYWVWTSDISYEYVKINAEYHT